MSLNERQRLALKEYYRELHHYSVLRREGVDCWDEYYAVLRKIKMLLRYGVIL